jgi:hypothetical protein
LFYVFGQAVEVDWVVGEVEISVEVIDVLWEERESNET